MIENKKEKNAEYNRLYRARKRSILQDRQRADLAGEMMLKYKLLNITIGNITFNASGLTHPIEQSEIDDDQPEDRFFKDLADPEIKYEDLHVG